MNEFYPILVKKMSETFKKEHLAGSQLRTRQVAKVDAIVSNIPSTI